MDKDLTLVTSEGSQISEADYKMSIVAEEYSSKLHMVFRDVMKKIPLGPEEAMTSQIIHKLTDREICALLKGYLSVKEDLREVAGNSLLENLLCHY